MTSRESPKISRLAQPTSWSSDIFINGHIIACLIGRTRFPNLGLQSRILLSRLLEVSHPP